MNPKSKEFQDLQSKWYGKLKKSGFEDIEQDDNNLKIWHSHFFALKERAQTSEVKAEYYRMASQFLNDYPFKTKVEQTIWELHSNGVGLRDIAKYLRSRGYKTEKNKVHGVVKNLFQIMVRNVYR